MSGAILADKGHRYTVVGAGAVGGTLAWHLAQAGHRVTVIDTDRAHVDRIAEHGLVLERDGHASEAIRFDAFTPDSFRGQLGAVLLAVKAQHTVQASGWIAERLDPEGWVASMQNGLNEDAIAKAVGRGRTVGAFVNFNADVIRPGVIHDGGIGALALGELDGTTSPRVRQLAEDLAHWGPVLLTGNIQGFLWAKLAYLAMLTATALSNEEMAESVRRYARFMSALAREVCAVAVEMGMVLEAFDAFDAPAYAPSSPEAVSEAATGELAAWMATLGKKHSGIWRDIVVRKRPAEVPTQYGPVLELARQHGVETPLTARTLEMLAETEQGVRGICDTNLMELDAAAAALRTGRRESASTRP
jgi:2-dehydropantoate 2-reductase